MAASNLDATATKRKVECTVTPELSAFWENNPKGWFAQVEAVFRLANIEQSLTKLEYISSVLTDKQSQPIIDIITEPPEVEPYEKAKAQLIKKFSYDPKNIRTFDNVEIGSRPTDMLRRMKELAPELNESAMRTVFLDKLPRRVREFARCLTKLDLHELAETADIIEKSLRPSAEEGLKYDCHWMIKLALNNLINEVKSSRECFEEYIYGQGSEEQSSSEFSDERICYYHWKFGDNAFKCRGRCDYNA
ncbi:uncharacterized protein LOC109534126 [Dendroctonus ponderosae]